MWGGIFVSNVTRVERKFYVFLELKQQGRAVWGIYNTTDSNNNQSVNCLCTISGSLPRKKGAFLDLSKESVVMNRSVSYAVCDLVSRLNLHYLTKDSVDYITGKWYAGTDIPGRQHPVEGDADGSLVLQRISGQMVWNADQYFSNLDKIIKRGAEDGQHALIADDVATASEREKRLLRLLQTVTGRKIID